MPNKYITPTTKIYSTFDEAREFYDKFGGLLYLDAENPLQLADLVQGKRNLVVGEPGVGKSLLLEKIRDHLIASGYETSLISLRQEHVAHLIDTFLTANSDGPKALLLDALDEIRGSLFPAVIQKLEQISRTHPEIAIYLSSRWVFIQRYATSFPEFRYIMLCPFTQRQVREYLQSANHDARDIDQLLNRIMSFSHRMIVIQIPRYLFYLEDFLRAKGLDAAVQVSRNDLFEYFIYRKLDHEDRKLQADKKAITKRILEKLALVMEIYQTNMLSKDELMTFFDEVESDLKFVALSQIELEVFYECSLLKNNIDMIEFDNTEFQEYLAAKEITRMPDPNRAVFGFTIDPTAKELYPTWFNSLSFLVDMQPELLEQLVEFTGIRAAQFKVMDDAFLVFLSRVDPRLVARDLRLELFRTLVDYHRRTGQWLPSQLAAALPGFFDATLEEDMKSWAAEVQAAAGAARFVPLGNIAYIVAQLLQSGLQIDRAYWRDRLIRYASDTNENGVLQRHAMFALERLGDPSVIEDLPSLMDAEELVSRAFLSLCTHVDPDSPKSIDYFVTAVKRGDFHGRDGILAMTQPASIKSILRTLITDRAFAAKFLDQASIFGDRDPGLVEHIKAILDDELRELCKQFLVPSRHGTMAHASERSSFITGLWKLLRSGDPGFVTEMVRRIKDSRDGKVGLYFAQRFFAEVIQEEDVPAYIDAMVALREDSSAFSVMQQIRLSKRDDAQRVYEAGRSRLAEDYNRWEERLTRPDTAAKERDEELLREFEARLEPSPGKFSFDVFEFYNKNKKRLDPIISSDERTRLTELITGTVLKFVDPSTADLTITSEHNGSRSYTTTTSVALFAEALTTAQCLQVDVRPFRQHIINFIPFAYHDSLRTIFSLVKDISLAEMQPVIEIYKQRKSDLWRHQPSSFVEAVEQYHVAGAAALLKQFVREPAWDLSTRQHALTAAEALAPDPAFLGEIAVAYSGSTDANERRLVETANGLLITIHADSSAIHWRLNEVVGRAAKFVRSRGRHMVSELEDEIQHSKTFAKPLMDLKRPGFEDDYLKLLDEAMGLWARGTEFYAYASYLWEIVCSYFDNLKEARSYTPLRRLEQKIGELKDRDGANWLAGRMVQLRKSYLTYLGKLRNVSAAIGKYNDARAYDDKEIRNSSDLFRHIQDSLDTDLRRWIEGEGAYSLILGEKVYQSERQEYEKLIQKTLKAQVENILLRRGFQVEVMREPELLDGRKTDFWVRYGFVGPVIIEVKLSSNTDLKGTEISTSRSYVNMERYMNGYLATHGILLVINNDNAENLPTITEIFQRIPNVWVHSFECYKSATKSRPNPRPTAKSKRRSRRSG